MINSLTRRDWQPATTWAFVVGTLSWQYPDMFPAFPVKARRDAELVAFLAEQGVPAAQMVYLADAAATLAAITAEFPRLLARTRPGDVVLVYYCGHGYDQARGRSFFASYDASDTVAGWHMQGIPKVIAEYAPHATVLFALDCCSSGSLAQALARHTDITAACLASVTARETSTGNWTFSDTLLAGLRGAAYAEVDGQPGITISELAQQLAADMLFAEQQQAAFGLTPGFNPNFVVAPARPKHHPRIGERVEVLDDGEWYKAQIIDARDACFLVHYYGWDASADAWVAPSAIRVAAGPTQYAVGTSVEVRWKGEWFAATVLEVNDGSHLIHYADYDADWDEWVAAGRIRRA